MTSVLELLDWRRQVHDLYDGVRAELYPHVAHAGWSAVRDRLLADHPCSPVPDREGFPGLVVADHDPAWRATARLEPAEPLRLDLPTDDGPVPLERAGVLRTPWGTLDAWELRSYGGGLWIPVRDAGSGSVSYGGGRYLYDTATGADLGTTPDGELVLDLNFLYAPDCAHDPRWSSPLPPAGNVLDVVVPVGELLSP